MRRIRTKLVLSLMERALEEAVTLSRQLYARHQEEALELVTPLATSPHVLGLLTQGENPEAQDALRGEAAMLGEYALDVYDTAGARVASIRMLPDSLLEATPKAQHVEVNLGSSAGDLGAQLTETMHTSVVWSEGGLPIDAHAERLVELAHHSEPVVLEGDNGPGFVSVLLPVAEDGRRLGHILIARHTPDGFPGHARYVMAGHRFFKMVWVTRGGLQRAIIGVS